MNDILNSLIDMGAKPVLVGGCVRDHFLNLPLKDYDIEVFNIDSYEALAKHLESFGKVELVGKSFGVLKLFADEYEYDFALPRREKKVGLGHQGFEVESDAFMSFEQAAIRRDFTVNAIGYEVSTQKFLDPFNGLEDMKHKTLRHINEHTFIEDPLRVYRAIQFAARFEFELHASTLELCQSMTKEGLLEELAVERVFEEFKKFLLQASKPSIAMKLLDEMGILKYFPELEVLKGCIQDEEYHPEGDVWIHTLMTMDEMVKLRGEDAKENLILMLAILCHDLGKPFCTKEIEGRITSHKHEILGVEPTISFLSRLSNEKKLIDEVTPLVQYHLSPFQFYFNGASSKAVKRLSTKVNIERLCKVALADCLGRDILDKDKCPKAVNWLLDTAKELNIEKEALKPLVQGRDLIALGLKPSKEFAQILEFAFELQIDDNLSKDEILSKIKASNNLE